jgi:hypothetical protein
MDHSLKNTNVPPSNFKSIANNSVLAVGICLAEKENNFDGIVEEINNSSQYSIRQEWASLGKTELIPKFQLINTLLANADLSDFEYILVIDDDIELPKDFLDDYLGYIRHYDLALAQPARTLDSFIDHPFVGQMPGLIARRTRFVEIGPLFSIRRDLFDVLLPFDESSPMGWGYDLAWPVIMERKNLKMGIVDATPVTHNLRKPVSNYDFGEAQAAMDRYLSRQPHLSFDEAFTIIESYSSIIEI